MASSESKPGVVAHFTSIVRLLILLLAALPLTVQGQLGQDELALCIGYFALGSVLLLASARFQHPSILYASTISDVAFIAAFGWLAREPAFPLWALYLLPIAAAATGLGPAIAAAALSIGTFAASTWLRNGALSSSDLWLTAVLIAASLTMVLMSSQWRRERREKRIWQEMAAALRPLARDRDPEMAAAAVVERARLLLRSKTAWLWWIDSDGKLRPGASAGRGGEWPVVDAVDARKLQRIDRSIPLADLQAVPNEPNGLAITLRQGRKMVALLAVSCERSRCDQAKMLGQLAIYAPWAAGTLVAALDRADLAEELRWERILRRAASELAGTLDGVTTKQTVAEAARTGLNAIVSVGEAQSGEVSASEAPEEPVNRLKVDLMNDIATEPATESIAATASEVTDRSLADLTASKLSEREARRLKELTHLATEALRRCSTHEGLQLEVQRLHATIEGAPMPLAVWHSQGRLLLANAVYRSLRLDDVVPRGAPPAPGREIEVVAGDRLRTFIVHTSPVDTSHTVVLYREITREREAIRTKDQLISTVGHELRSPLTSIYGYSQMMSRQLGVVQQQVNQLNHLIGDFMDASRIEGGQLPLNRHPVDLFELVQSAADRFRGAFDGRRLRVEAEQVPPVAGDQARLSQVLDNLLANAGKYSPPEEEILLEVRREANQVIITVRDRGVGIAPEHLPHIFDRLYRAPGPETARVKGLGLGLCIVQDLVKAHGGQVWAESMGIGKGSTFRISIPIFAPTGTPRDENHDNIEGSI